MRSKIKNKYISKKNTIDVNWKKKDVTIHKKKIKGRKIYKDNFIVHNINMDDKTEKIITENKIKLEKEYLKKDRKLKKMQWIIGIILLFLFIFLIALLSIPKINLDNSNNTVRYNSEYKNTGYRAKSFFKDYSNQVSIKGNVDTSKIGKYKIKYTLIFSFFTISKEKEVEVIDDIKPELTLTGNSEVVLCPNQEYVEEGYQAFDEYDGNIKDKVIITKNEKEIIYQVSDNSLNEDKKVRNIKYEDIESPKIELMGSKEVTIYKNDNYKESGYKAQDNCDGDISDKVKVTGDVDSSKIGEYEITYRVADSSLNEYKVTRRVHVVNRPNTFTNNQEEGVIYLTFDDGPSNLTLEILKILEEEQVKATFFVTGKVNDFSNILKKEYQEGHSIALHSYSHDYAYIYSNTNNFFRDIEKINDSVERIIGTKSKIIRFPGGSSNTVSRKYCMGIMSSLTNEVINRGYHYFDWNVDSDDAGNSLNDANKIYTNVTNNLSHSKANVVLMHDSLNHNATVRALQKIIDYGKENGYSFKKIENFTPMVRHNVNN